MASASLTRRLIWTLTVAAVALWIVAALLAANTLRTRLDAAFDGGLKETGERLLSLAVDSLGSDGDEPRHGSEAHEVPLYNDSEAEYIVYQVRAVDGSILLRSHDAPEMPFAVPLVRGFADSGQWRVYTIDTPEHDTFIQVAEASQHRTDSLWGSVLSLLWPIGLLVPLSAFGIFLAVRSGLRPMREFSAQISERHASNLTPVGDAGLPSELQPVAHAVDAVLGRVRSALDAERAFAANSAHELRTPIAGSLAQTQRLIAELEEGPQRGRAEQVELSLLRLRSLSEKLLQLSRADAAISGLAEPVDLLPAVKVLVEDARRADSSRDRISLSIDAGAVLAAPIDVDAFGIALRNVLENARVHGDAAEPIHVVVHTGSVEVTNGGTLVPPDRLSLLTNRFSRGDTEAEGSGLGLSIVDVLMRQAGGQLDLMSPAPGQENGFCARLRFIS
ncbi:MAG: ATP-binding protein [Devosia sp.]